MYKGRVCSVDYACRSNGSYPAEEFVKGLTEAEQVKLSRILQKLIDTGKVWNEEKFKHLDGPIYEMKSDENRLLCFQTGNCWVLTNGFKKDSQKTWRNYIALAKTIMNEHLSRK
jgi:hypothetical protein